MPLVEKRYAQALVLLSVSDNAIDDYVNDMKALADLFNMQKDFRLFLLNPRIKTDAKKIMIKSFFEGKIHPKIQNFLLLILDKGRINLLPGISREFERLADRERKVLNITVYSAFPIDEAQLNSIKERYGKRYNASLVKADIIIDSGLIGGVKVKLKDRVSDRTVKGMLDDLRKFIVDN